ncbi:MAG: CbiX/SirB N-terminal domain-containing protein [Phycisphaerae bacterium]|jgi:hypothetical protein
MKRLDSAFLALILVAVSLSLGGCSRTAPFRPADNVRLASETQPAADARPGLLLVAHGAPWAEWNKPLLDLEQQVRQELGTDGPFQAMKLVFMEFTEPTVLDGVQALEAAGCDRIVAVPLLIAPSTHSHQDVPSLLGLYTDARVRAALHAEGATPASSKLPITVTPTMDYGELLESVLLRRVQELSQDPANEAVVVLAHGDEQFEPIWGNRMRKLVTYLCGKTGISYGDYAFVHVGQGYGLNGVPVIAAAAGNRPRVLVVGCYLAMGTIGMHHRYMHTAAAGNIPMPNPLVGKDIAVARHGLLPDPEVARWVIATAKQALP